MLTDTENRHCADRQQALREHRHSEDATYVAVIHGIGATSHEGWTRQSVQTLTDWWITVRRGVDAEQVACPDGCRLGAGHQHLRLSAHGCSRRVDPEALFWGDCVRRPDARKCAWLVLQAGLLIGLVDTAAAWLTAFEFADFSSEVRMAHSVLPAFRGALGHRWNQGDTLQTENGCPCGRIPTVHPPSTCARIVAAVESHEQNAVDPDGRRVVFDAGSHLHLAQGGRGWLLDHVQTILETIARPDYREDDPRPGRERFYRQNALDPGRWLRVA